jgi:HD-GYP domain-containing protein (c-di-GMP phosphodiesterase class II)
MLTDATGFPGRTSRGVLEYMDSLEGVEKFFISIHPQILRIDTLRSFDVYSKNSDNHMILFHKAEEIYTAEHHGNIYRKNIPALYIRNIDRGRYNKYLEDNFSYIMDDPLINPMNKAEIAHEVITFLAKTLFTSPGAEIIINYKKAIERVVDFIVKNEEGIRYLIQMTSSSFHEYNHAVNVGIFGTGLAKEILTDSTIEHNMVEIASGFFLHDIGKFTIPKHISRRTGPLSFDEWRIMKKHPENGYKILRKFNALSDEIGVIILQHHERHDGKGYPAGLKGDRIHMYSKICSIADAFDALTSKRPYRTPKSSFNALAIMQNEMKEEFDPEFFSRFVLLFSRQ